MVVFERTRPIQSLHREVENTKTMAALAATPNKISLGGRRSVWFEE